jgi:hypothetical protein
VNPSDKSKRISAKRKRRSTAEADRLSTAYAEMTADTGREAEAKEWMDALCGDVPLD